MGLNDLKFEDLWTDCVVCKGQGDYVETTPAMGTAGTMSSPTAMTCRSCHGEKGKLTPLGNTLFQFFRKLKDAQKI